MKIHIEKYKVHRISVNITIFITQLMNITTEASLKNIYLIRYGLAKFSISWA